MTSDPTGTTWQGAPEPGQAPIGATGWVRIVVRGGLILCVILVGLGGMGPLRLIERPLFGAARPWTPWITQGVCRIALRCMGLRLVRQGARMTQRGAVVANHSSWLDIFVLNASDRVFFVSKDDVARWPGIGALARITGTVFIARRARAARAQTDLFETRLLAGHRLLFFPEGTSTDGLQVLAFKTTLFAAFFAPELRDHMHIQPVSITYHAPPGHSARTYGWWGDMAFGPHLLHTLALPRQGHVAVRYHPPLAVAHHPDRKALARAAEASVRGGHVPEAGTHTATR